MISIIVQIQRRLARRTMNIKTGTEMEINARTVNPQEHDNEFSSYSSGNIVL